jgi:hypothetical protein
MTHKEMWCEVVGWILLAQIRYQWWAVVEMTLNPRVLEKGGIS